MNHIFVDQLLSAASRARLFRLAPEQSSHQSLTQFGNNQAQAG